MRQISEDKASNVTILDTGHKYSNIDKENRDQSDYDGDRINP